MKTNTENRPNYRIYDRTGGGVTEDIYAETLEEAIEAGREWIEDGDWSGLSGGEDAGEGRVYRTVALECEVSPIIRSAYYIVRYSSGSPAEMDGPFASIDDARAKINGEHEVSIEPYDSAEDGVYRSQEARGVDRENVSVELVEGWSSDEGSEDYEAVYEAYGTDVDGDEQDLRTAAAQRHDCSGTYSDELPDCEARDHGPENTADPDHLSEEQDAEGHIWESPYQVVGGIRENPGVWGGQGTYLHHRSVCRLCGQYRETTTGGREDCDHGKPISTVTIKDRDEASTAWLKRTHEDDGYLPAWLVEMLGEEGERLSREEMEQAFRDFAADEAQDVSHGLFVGAEDNADAVATKSLSRDEAEAALDDLRERLQEAAAE